MTPFPRTRVRTRQRTRQSGSQVEYNSTTGKYTTSGPFLYIESEKRTTDVVGKGKRLVDGLTPPSAFESLEREVNPPTVNLWRKSSTATIPNLVIKNAPGNQQFATGPLLVSPAGGWGSLEPDDNAAIAKLLARTNPFRYTISIPLMIVELTESTSLLALNMANLTTILGSSYLNIQFGLKPLIADIKTLDKIVGHIESRIKEFNSLISKGGVRRRVLISKKTQKTTFAGRACYSYPSGTFYANGSTTYRSHVWATCRWRPQRDKVIEIEKLVSSRKAIAKIVLGLEGQDIPGLWEMLPFSWLADYFANIGDILQAVEKTDFVIPFDICVMRERRVQVATSVDCSPHNTNGTTIRRSNATAGTVNITMKNRIYYPSIGDIRDLLSFGFMSELQSLNLVALVASLKGRHLKL